MSDTNERSSREISLEIAESMLQARAAIDGECGNYDTATDPEGYVRSILIALMHHCLASEIDWTEEVRQARAAVQDDLWIDRNS